MKMTSSSSEATYSDISSRKINPPDEKYEKKPNSTYDGKSLIIAHIFILTSYIVPQLYTVTFDCQHEKKKKRAKRKRRK
jgi:hypothetical protein